MTTSTLFGLSKKYLLTIPKLFLALFAALSLTVVPVWASPASVIATVDVGGSPRLVALNPTTNKIYVGVGGGITVMDGITHTTTAIAAGVIPQAIAVNPVTDKIYTVFGGGYPYWYSSGNVTVIDGSNNSSTTITTELGGGYPAFIALNPVTNRIYVASYQPGYPSTVMVIDGNSDSIIDTTTGVAGQPIAIAVNPVTNKVYVAYNSDTGIVSVIDGATNSTTMVAVGYSPRAIAVNPVTNRIYVVNQSNYPVIEGTVTIIDGANNTTTTVAVGSYPLAVAVNTATNKIYVANYGSNAISVIDGATNNITNVPVGIRPQAIEVNPVTNQIYVANQPIYPVINGTVTVIDGASNFTSTVEVGAFPVALAVNKATNRIYVPNRASSNVSVIAGATSYDFGGFLSPLTLDGRTTFHLGGVIPVKFRLTDASGAAVTSAVARITLQQVSGGEPVGAPIDGVTVGGADSGNLFRINGDTYSFNLSTRSLSAGSYLIQAVLDDGTVHSIQIGLTAK